MRCLMFVAEDGDGMGDHRHDPDDERVRGHGCFDYSSYESAVFNMQSERPPGRAPCTSLPLLLLIYPHVVDFEPRRKPGC